MTSEAPPTDKPAHYTLLPVGHVVAGRYRVERIVGEGAQGVVYEARRAPGDARVALKVLHRHLCGGQPVKRFEREARILQRLGGEHLVKLLDFLEEDGLLILALEYVDGTSLEARLDEQRPLAIKEAVEIALQICAALGVAHAAGVVHRDLKPANVLLERPEPEPASTPAPLPGGLPAPAPGARSPSAPPGIRVRVVDFGVAKILAGDQAGTNLTDQGMIFGTPEYMAPEQARGDEADARSDLYATGVMLYEMVVGQTPFHGRTAVGTMTAHLTEPPPPPRAARPGEITASLEAVILRALTKSRDERYPDARTFAEALAATRNDHRVVAVLSTTMDPELAAIGDTDLQVSVPSIATAKTLQASLPVARSHAALRAGATDRATGHAENDASARHPSTPTSQRERRSDAAVYGFVSGSSTRSRWFWVLVAIVAAAIGAALGAFIGAR